MLILAFFFAVTTAWQPLALGVETTTLPLIAASPFGDGQLHVVRIDASKAHLRALSVSEVGGMNRTAKDWSKEFHLVAVINAGMYAGDLKTHSGYFRVGKTINSSDWVKNFQSVLRIGSRHSEHTAIAMEDSIGTDDGSDDIVIQNLRLVRGSGVNVWPQNKRKWSESAIAVDDQGRLLFLFCRTPLTMHDFVDRLLALPLGVIRAMHVEGGPEASLSIHGADIDFDADGSYETGFNEDDQNDHQWPLPNVIGVESR